eukprot:11721397-Alexandrium_andersonii.AAC.1
MRAQDWVPSFVPIPRPWTGQFRLPAKLGPRPRPVGPWAGSCFGERACQPKADGEKRRLTLGTRW